MAGSRVEAKQVSVVRFEENSRMPYGHTAVVVLRRIIDQPLGNGPRIMPNDSPRSSVEGERVVGSCDKHDSVYDHRSNLKLAGARRVKYPLRAELRDIADIDLVKANVAPPRIVAVVRKPVRAGRLRCQFIRMYIDDVRNSFLRRGRRRYGDPKQRDRQSSRRGEHLATVPLVHD